MRFRADGYGVRIVERAVAGPDGCAGVGGNRAFAGIESAAAGADSVKSTRSRCAHLYKRTGF